MNALPLLFAAYSIGFALTFATLVDRAVVAEVARHDGGRLAAAGHVAGCLFAAAFWPVAIALLLIVGWSERRRARLPSITGLEVVAWAHVASSWLTVAGAAPWWLAGGTYAIGAVVAVAPASELLASKTRRSPRTVAAVLLAAILWPGLAVVVAYRRGAS